MTLITEWIIDGIPICVGFVIGSIFGYIWKKREMEETKNEQLL